MSPMNRITAITVATLIGSLTIPSAHAQVDDPSPLGRIRVILEIENDYATAEKELRALIGKSQSTRLRAEAKLLLAKALLRLERKGEAGRLLDEVARSAPELEQDAKDLLRKGAPRDKLRARIQSEVSRLLSDKKAVSDAAKNQLIWLADRAQPYLVETLQHFLVQLDDVERLLSVIFTIGGPPVVEVIEKYSRYDDPTIRKAILDEADSHVDDSQRKLGSRLDKALRVFLDDPDARLRAHAIDRYYYMFRDSDAVLRALDDASAMVRASAAYIAGDVLAHLLTAKDATRHARLSAKIIDVTKEDDKVRRSFLDGMTSSTDNERAFARSKQSWMWLLDNLDALAEQSWKADPAHARVAPDLVMARLEKPLTERAGAILNDIALRCTPDVDSSRMASTIELAKRLPDLDWWSKFRPAFEARDAYFIIEHIGVFLRGAPDQNAVIGFVGKSLGAKWSPESTKRVVDKLAVVLKAPAQPVRPISKGATSVMFSMQAAATRPARQLIKLMVSGGDFESMRSVMQMLSGDAELWAQWMVSLAHCGRVIPADIAAESLRLEPVGMAKLGKFGSTRNSLFAFAARGGARNLGPILADAYRRGISSTTYQTERYKRTNSMRGLEWILQKHPVPLQRAYSTDEVVAIIRACMDASGRGRDDFCADISTVIDRPNARFEEAFAAPIVDWIREHPDQYDAYIALDAILTRFPTQSEASAVAARLLLDPKTRPEYLSSSEGRPAYLEPMLEILPEARAKRDIELLESLCWSLRQIGGKRALDALVELLKDPSLEVRRYAIEGLAEHPKSDQVLRAFDLADDPAEKVRETLAQVSKVVMRPEIAPKILPMLEDQSDYVRKTVKVSLENLRFLDQQRSHWKAWLARRGQPSAPMALLAQARDEKRSKAGRLAAIQSLAAFKDVEALPALVDFLEHDDADFRAAAKAAIEAIRKK